MQEGVASGPAAADAAAAAAAAPVSSSSSSSSVSSSVSRRKYVRQRIEFHLATKRSTCFQHSRGGGRGTEGKAGQGAQGDEGNPDDEEKQKQKEEEEEEGEEDSVLRLPRKGLFSSALVYPVLQWRERARRIGPGLRNVGNSCYLNSVLQCLLYVPPLAQLLLQMKVNTVEGPQRQQKNFRYPAHRFGGFPGGKKMKKRAWQQQQQQQQFQQQSERRPKTVLDAMAQLCHTVHLTGAGRQSKVLTPTGVLHKLRNIGQQFHAYVQEDAHEFCVKLLDKVHDNLLARGGLDPREYVRYGRLAETTMVDRIFRGYLRTRVECKRCQFRSDTYDSALTLELSIASRASTLEQVIEQFCRPEVLQAKDGWKCERCKDRVPATKATTIFRPPLVLAIQLKRFGFALFSQKLNKHIAFKERLQLHSTAPPAVGGGTAEYRLASILVHFGGSVDSGHYIAAVRGPNQMWYQMDDENVSQVSTDSILRHRAYMLFYVRTAPSTAKLTAAASSVSSSASKLAMTAASSALSAPVGTGDEESGDTKRGKGLKPTKKTKQPTSATIPPPTHWPPNRSEQERHPAPTTSGPTGLFAPAPASSSAAWARAFAKANQCTKEGEDLLAAHGVDLDVAEYKEEAASPSSSTSRSPSCSTSSGQTNGQASGTLNISHFVRNWQANDRQASGSNPSTQVLSTSSSSSASASLSSNNDSDDDDDNNNDDDGGNGGQHKESGDLSDTEPEFSAGHYGPTGSGSVGTARNGATAATAARAAALTGAVDGDLFGGTDALDGSGTWEYHNGEEPETAASSKRLQKAVAAKAELQANAIKRRRQPSYIDDALDRGRVAKKKLKSTQAGGAAVASGSGPNLFQQETQRRQSEKRQQKQRRPQSQQQQQQQRRGVQASFTPNRKYGFKQKGKGRAQRRNSWR